MDKRFILKNQNWMLPTYDSFPWSCHKYMWRVFFLWLVQDSSRQRTAHSHCSSLLCPVFSEVTNCSEHAQVGCDPIFYMNAPVESVINNQFLHPTPSFTVIDWRSWDFCFQRVSSDFIKCNGRKLILFRTKYLLILTWLFNLSETSSSCCLKRTWNQNGSIYLNSGCSWCQKV